jgi:outer membrane protein TolC
MHGFRSLGFVRAAAALAVAVLLAGGGVGAAQQADYSRSAPIFPQVFRPYEARHVAEPVFVNSRRLEQLVHDGKLSLSLDDAIALALENNLDLVIARYNLPIADTDILRTKSGASDRGVNTGIVSGTPGGGVGAIGNTGAQGGGAGGTTAAAGGAGTGTFGIVASTLGVGPPVDSFDPVITGSFGLQYANTPQATIETTGAYSTTEHTAAEAVTYSQGFPTGTLLNVSFNNSRFSSNDVYDALLPQFSSSYLVQFRQHLLEGLSRPSNRRYMLIARNNREIADVSFRQQVIFTVTQIENLYWNLVSAVEDLKANQEAVRAAQQLEANNRRQVEAGTMAPIEIVNAEAQVAASRQNLIVSQTNLQLQQLLMRNAVTKNGDDPAVAEAEVIPTDRMELPPAEPVVPIQDLVREALQKRPELTESLIDLTNRRISKDSARNALLPSLDLVANYGGAGLAGALNPACAGCPLPPNLGSLPDAITDLSGHPTYFVGLNLNIPIRNRTAQADQVRSELEYRQAEARLQQLKNQIAIDVRNAQFAVQQNRARVEAAIKGREYSAQSLDAEQKKLAEGISTTYNVMLALTNLATAESNLVGAMTAYEQSQVLLDVVTGRVLERLGIDLGDSEQGVVSKLPHVPEVAPAVRK